MGATLEVLSAAASTTPWGQVLGLVGGLGTGIVNYFARKDERKHELALKDLDMKLLIAKGNVDAATLAGELAKLREQGAAAAFTASIEAEAKLPRSWRWIDALRAATRPGLTWYFTFIFTCMSLCILRGWGATYFDHPLFAFIFATTANLMEMCVTWWFGQRQIEKMTTSWGNSMVNAKVGGAKS